MRKQDFKAEDVKSRMHETAYLNPNLTIVFEDLRDAETETYQFTMSRTEFIGFIQGSECKERR